jgi:hypothetical protein
VISDHAAAVPGWLRPVMYVVFIVGPPAGGLVVFVAALANRRDVNRGGIAVAAMVALATSATSTLVWFHIGPWWASLIPGGVSILIGCGYGWWAHRRYGAAARTRRRQLMVDYASAAYADHLTRTGQEPHP